MSPHNMESSSSLPLFLLYWRALTFYSTPPPTAAILSSLQKNNAYPMLICMHAAEDVPMQNPLPKKNIYIYINCILDKSAKLQDTNLWQFVFFLTTSAKVLKNACFLQYLHMANKPWLKEKKVWHFGKMHIRSFSLRELDEVINITLVSPTLDMKLPAGT